MVIDLLFKIIIKKLLIESLGKEAGKDRKNTHRRQKDE
jgi:hypothetical protein